MSETMIPYRDLPDPIKKQVDAKCASPDCISAKNEMENIRFDIQLACQKKSDAEAIRNQWAAAAATMFATAAALTASGAATAGLLVGLVLLVAAAVVAGIGAIFGAIAAGWAVDVGNQIRKIQQLQQDFRDAAIRMRTACSEYCFADANLPKC